MKIKECSNQCGLELYINLRLRRSVDKYKPEVERDWEEEAICKEITCKHSYFNQMKYILFLVRTDLQTLIGL